MSSGPETRFIKAVHKLLPRTVYREKMHNIYRGGTPDVWYSGNADDLWTEYKVITVLPVRAPICLDKLLSPLQQQWLLGRHEEGRNVVVILGTPKGAWVFEGAAWTEPLNPAAIKADGLTKRNVAEYITKRTCLNDEMANPRYAGERSDLSSAVDDDDDGLPDP